MGLRDDLIADAKQAFNTDLSEALTEFVALRDQQGIYDPVSDSYSDSVPLEISGRGVMSDYAAHLVDGVRVLASDQQLLCIYDELSGPLEIGDVINGYRVHHLTKDSLAVSVTVQLRRLGGSNG